MPGPIHANQKHADGLHIITAFPLVGDAIADPAAFAALTLSADDINKAVRQVAPPGLHVITGAGPNTSIFLPDDGGPDPTLAAVLNAGNATGGSDIEVTPGDKITSPAAGGDVDVEGGPGFVSAGGDINLSGGIGDGGNKGGDIVLTGGTGNGAGFGGEVNIRGGAPGTSFGGAINLCPGVGAKLRMETENTSSTVGDMELVGGDTSSALGNLGGKILIQAGSSTNIGGGGPVDIKAGNGLGGGLAGPIDITAGNGSGIQAGGNVTIKGGTGGATNGDGGDVVLQPGAAQGTGEPGTIEAKGSIQLDEVPTPTNVANKGFVIVSDGSGGLVANGLYYIDENGNAIRLDRQTKTLFFAADPNGNNGSFRARNVGGSGNFNFNFAVPADFQSLVSLEAVSIVAAAGAAGAGKDIDDSSEYGAIGELSNNHAESDVGSTYTIPAQGTLYARDVSGVFSALAAGDLCGLNINHNGIGGALDYLYLKMVYNT